MTRLRAGLLIASACTLVGVVCFVAGRVTAPAPPALQAETSQASKAAATSTAKVDAVTAATGTSTALAVDKGVIRTRTVIKRVLVPTDDLTAPPCVEETTIDRVEAKDETKTATATSSARSATSSAATLATETETFAASKVVLAAPALPRLGAGALGRIGLDGRMGWGPAAAVRLGPVWVTAAADVPARALLVTGVVTW